MISQYILLALGFAAWAASLVFIFKPRWWAAPLAWLALLLLHLSYYIGVHTDTFIFWGIAAALAAGMTYLRPNVDDATLSASNLYIAVSAIAGCLLGMLLGARMMVLGVIVGAFIGLMAFTRTPAGRPLRLAYSDFLYYFCAKCLPVIVTVAIDGIAIEGFIL